MAQTATYWNPGLLLDITSPSGGEWVQCVGYAKTRGTRCGWTHRDSSATAILSQLAQLAARPPTQVTSEDLETLAKLCLCSDWHYSQWVTVSQRWDTIVAKAKQQHEQAVALQAATQKTERLLHERKQCFEMLGVKKETETADLLGALAAYHLSNGIAQRESAIANTQLQEKLSAAQNDLTSVQARLQTAETELEAAHRRQAVLTEEYRAAVFKVEESRKSERARLTELVKIVETANHERGRLETMVALLRAELEATARMLEEEKRNAEKVKEAKHGLELSLAEAVLKLQDADRLAEERKALAEERTITAAGLEEEIHSIRTQLLGLSEEKTKAAALEQEVEDLKSMLGGMYIEEEQAKLNLSAANTEVDRYREEAATKAKELQASRDAFSALERQLTDMKTKEEYRAAQLGEFKRDYEALRLEHASTVDQVKTLQADLRDEKEATRLIRNDRSATEITLQQTQTGMRNIRAANEQLAREKSVLQAHILALEAQASRSWRNKLRVWVGKVKAYTAA